MTRLRTLMIGVTLAALVATGCEWHLQTLDGEGGPPGSTSNAVGAAASAIVYNGNPHVFYYDRDDDSLRHSYWNGSAWAFEALDGAASTRPGHTTNNVGGRTAALLYNGRPHVFYYDLTDRALRHAYWNGVFWAYEVLDGTGSVRPGHSTHDVGGTITALLYNGRPHVFHYDRDDESLRHAYWNGVFWAYEVLDGTGSVRPGHTENTVGADGSAAVVYKGRPHLFYADDDAGTLRHTYWNGVFWAYEVLDGTGSVRPGHTENTVGYSVSVVLYEGRPFVFYEDITDENLRGARWTGAVWDFETIDSSGDLAGNGTAAVVYGGEVSVFYEEFGTFSLRRASMQGSPWSIETFDGTGSTRPGHSEDMVGIGPTAITYGGKQYVFYSEYTEPPSLRHAWFG